MPSGEISFSLFIRPGAPASDAALEALKAYCEASPAACHIIDVNASPDAASLESVVIVPTLVVKRDGATRRLVTGLAPLDTLRKTLADLDR